MKNTKRYLSIFLALALAAPVFTGCDNGLDEYKSGETIAPPSDKFNAEIQFVTRLTDGALAGSDADYAAIDNYMVNTLEGRGKSWLTVLDRADGANLPKTMQTALNTKRWTAFAFNRIANKSSYQGSMLYFNGPTTEVKGTPSGSGCYVTGFAPTLNGTRTDKDEDGNYNRLPNPNIDTGMGLERLAVVMQGVDNLFEIDTVQDVMKHICRIANIEYKKDDKKDVSLRVITDHIRSTVMMVSDGVIPSNEGRGYVLRRLLRRAARHGKLLGINKQFLFEVADTVIECSKGAYPELDEKRDYIRNIIKKEEERFDATIDNGLNVLNGYIEAAQKEGRKELTGKEAFKLHDTYGFPVDLTIEMAEEKGLEVDVDGFNKAMQEQKDNARDARAEGSSWDGNEKFEFENAEPTVFVGYDTLETDAKLSALLLRTRAFVIQ